MNQFFTKTPALKGIVKQRYADFMVEEILVDGTKCEIKRFDKPFEEREITKEMIIPPRNEEEYLLLEMEKINYDTNTALAFLARGLNLSKKRMGYAGLKDKRAITCQQISLYLPKEELVKKFGVKGIELRNPKWSKKRTELGDLLGNEFTITIRGITQTEEEITNIIEEFSKEVKQGVPNFFGNQRFGGKRMITHRVGKLLLKEKIEEAIMLYLTETYPEEKIELKNARINLAKTRDYKQALKEFPSKDARTEKAILNHLTKHPNDFAGALNTIPKKMRYLFTHAVQSDIYNKILQKRIEKYKDEALKQIDGDEIVNGEPTILLPGYESTYSKGEAGEIEKEVMKEENLTFEDFKMNKLSELSSKGDRKSILLKPQNFTLTKIFDDEYNEGKKAITIKFFLTKGNYATTILRELIKEEIF
ncbi:MAG: tRNA pseudouridine(13) synthase TruD [Candidatus Iainarchaeum sp.]|jgi:tRNA pseudouridine13 synthase|nr:MAG: putative tRNA pseudouridine synthase D [archaeon ADurb.Bin336]